MQLALGDRFQPSYYPPVLALDPQHLHIHQLGIDKTCQELYILLHQDHKFHKLPTLNKVTHYHDLLL